MDLVPGQSRVWQRWNRGQGQRIKVQHSGGGCLAKRKEKFQNYLSREGERLRQQDRAAMGKN
uniref:Uncharacterized protein n=1 Tax=Oryza brachyantha TaxID=4533 RepID=J3M676_ORYBR